MKCKACGRNIAIGCSEEAFRELSSKKRQSYLNGTQTWLNKFKKIHDDLNKKEKKAKEGK